jgi:hypothetical protein
MPDHAHCLWIGLHSTSDQRTATSFLRRAINNQLRPARLQPQAHDHILREKERESGAFTEIWNYIARNPERADLVKNWRDYPFLGSCIPGYMGLDPRDEDYWPRLWRILAAAQARWSEHLLQHHE